MKLSKKIITSILVLVFIMGVLPCQVYADEEAEKIRNAETVYLDQEFTITANQEYYRIVPKDDAFVDIDYDMSNVYYHYFSILKNGKLNDVHDRCAGLYLLKKNETYYIHAYADSETTLVLKNLINSAQEVNETITDTITENYRKMFKYRINDQFNSQMKVNSIEYKSEGAELMCIGWLEEKGGETYLMSITDLMKNQYEESPYPYLSPINGYIYFYVITQHYLFDTEYEIRLTSSNKQVQHTISYHINGGINSADNPTLYIEGQEITLSNPTKEGYKFEGWYKDKDFNKIIKKISVSENKDLNLYAKWSPIQYSITYNLDGGINNRNNPTTYTIETNIKLKNAKRKGYKFKGWYNEDGIKTKEIKKGNMGNITLSAKWKKKKK